MYNQEHKDWKPFRFDEIFIIKGGFYNKKPKFDKNGDIPFLGATNSNNGVTGFCTLEEIEKTSKIGHGKNHDLKDKIFDGNCIAVTNNGSVGHAYYQINEFTCSHDINVLYLKNHKLNKNIAMFLVVAIEQQKTRFAYSRKWRPMRMKSSKLMLPVTEDGHPDYDFMESYMEQVEEKTIAKYNKMIKKINESNKLNTVSLNSVLWKEFFITDIGTISSGKDITQDEMIDGSVPYVSATSQNNGISAYVGNTNNTLESDCISINRNGSIGYAFYHPYPALFSNDCRKLKVNKDKYISLFIANQIKAQKDKYNYGYKMGTNRIKRQKILLPADDNGEPDYNYMKQYMINLEFQMLTKYLNYITTK